MKNKIAKNSQEAHKLEDDYTNRPHGGIQWKGTSVCMDVFCKCGYMSHIDTDFASYIRCPNCGTVYSVSGQVEFVEISEFKKELVKVAYMDIEDTESMV